ncbi:polysaccharide deacetylase family protein [Nitratireductor luteus]|uniref:polysaccharide deacetylase family protein n=1 Tax=Nitratireductor luteus TaxID=2976980 RepID=UPI00223FC2A4|nr:polysaccharide deacetylase family protein [Nitratireductor luteus]
MITGTTVRRFVRHALIRTGLEGISLTRAGHLWRGAAGRGVIFTLHHVRPATSTLTRPNALLSITPTFLEEAIQACLERGMTPLPLEDLPERLADSRDKRAYFCFTLDDGYRDNAQFATPVFRKYDVPYTIFLTSGFVERTRSIWWETLEAILAGNSEIVFDFGTGDKHLSLGSDIRKTFVYDRFVDYLISIDEDDAVDAIDRLARSVGIDPLALTDRLILRSDEIARLVEDPLCRFGGHSLTHVNLRRVDADRLKREVHGSLDTVERYTGYRPATFAYPYGYSSAVGPREIQTARQAGFKVAVTNLPGVLYPESTQDPTAFRRISLNGNYQKRRYVGALLSGVPFKLPDTRKA